MNKSQKEASRTLKSHASWKGRFTPTALDNNQTMSIINMAMGLAGESGEVLDYIKKVVFQGQPLDKEVVAGELGDVLWYVAGMCTVLDINMEDVAAMYIE